MSTWSDLIAEVRAQIDVEDDQALDWLLDRARVMNAASGWLLREATIPVTTAAVEYALPQDCVRTEALTLGGLVFQRSTLGSGDLTLRYLADVPVPATPASESPPFPADVHGGLSDGAIGIGLARMDERFDSASYFDARFTDATGRLKLRRHGHMGRGGTPIRIVS
jgi:hypothetical protein